MKDEVTTIQIKKAVVRELNRVKKYNRETYSDIISNLLNFIKNTEEKKEFDKFVRKIQEEKMRELWGNKNYGSWEKAWDNA